MNSPEMKEFAGKSKFSKNASHGKLTNGLIIVQHHGRKVWFKNKKVRCYKVTFTIFNELKYELRYSLTLR